MTKRLLCSKCEDLFSKNGEKIIGTFWATASSFPLLDVLSSARPLAVGPEFAVYDTSIIDKKSLDALFYFAASIFWRASVWDWGRERDRYVGALGARYEEAFRKFLLGGESLENVYMIISVNTSGNMNGLLTFPAANKMQGGKFHVFDILGIKFTAFVGGHIHSDILKPFFSSGSNVILMSAPLEESRDFCELAKALQTKVTARGRLLKESFSQ